jgi:hypothetical protein
VPLFPTLDPEPAGDAPQTVTVDIETGEFLIPVTPQCDRELGRTLGTVSKWTRDPKMNFPLTVRIRGRLYVARSDFELWKRRLFSGAVRGRVR